MAYVRVEQRNARLASEIRIGYVKGRDGNVAKGTVTIISNTRRGAAESRSEEATAIQWTLWGRQAENAAEYLSQGSRVNIVGRLQNNNFADADGRTVYGMNFTCEELDYLDSKSESKARKLGQQEWTAAYDRVEAAEVAAKHIPGKAAGRRGEVRNGALTRG